MPSLAKGDATGHTVTRVWPIHLFARSIADLRTAIDHGSKGPCAERKARHCNFRGDAGGLQGNVGKRERKRGRKRRSMRMGHLVVGKMRVEWNNIDTCASLLF